MSYHEKQLKKRLTDLQSDLDMDRDLRKRRKGQDREQNAFKKLPSVTPKMEFWCDHCNIDFVAPAYKTFSNIHQTGAWHSLCPLCDSFVYRHITAKILDPYYAKSEKVRVMRNEATIDMLQPGDYGFRMTYGDPYENYYRKFQQHSEAIFNKYASMGLMGKTLDQKEEEEEMVRQMI